MMAVTSILWSWVPVALSFLCCGGYSDSVLGGSALLWYVYFCKCSTEEGIQL